MADEKTAVIERIAELVKDNTPEQDEKFLTFAEGMAAMKRIMEEQKEESKK